MDGKEVTRVTLVRLDIPNVIHCADLDVPFRLHLFAQCLSEPLECCESKVVSTIALFW